MMDLEKVFNLKSDEEIFADLKKYARSKVKLQGYAEEDYILAKCVEHEFLYGVKRSIDDGANVHIGNELPLKMAVWQNSKDVVKILVENGANPERAIVYYKEKGYYHFVEFLNRILNG